MSIKEIAEKVAQEYFTTHPAETLPEAIERAIREAAKPLVEALEMAEHLLEDDPAIHEVIVTALAAWKEGR